MRAPTIAISRGNVAIWIAGSVGLLLLGMLLAGFDLWFQAYYFVSTDNAQVTGSFVQVGAPGPAQVAAYEVQVGDTVGAGETVALLQLAGPAGAAGSSAPAGRVNVHLRAPRTGVVVSLPAREGQLVTAGQPVAVLADPAALWVVANVDENALKSVRRGQPAEVHVGLLDRTLQGYVAEVLPEFAPGTAAPGARGRPSAIVPVRVELDADAAAREGLYPGMSAYVKIRIR